MKLYEWAKGQAENELRMKIYIALWIAFAIWTGYLLLS